MGERIERPVAVGSGAPRLVQVMEGRHCFAHLTIEENLLTGAYTRSDGRRHRAPSWSESRIFPAPHERRTVAAGYTSGGEQQMCAIGRALMAQAEDDPAG